jgi:hypothetical protein
MSDDCDDAKEERTKQFLLDQAQRAIDLRSKDREFHGLEREFMYCNPRCSSTIRSRKTSNILVMLVMSASRFSANSFGPVVICRNGTAFQRGGRKWPHGLLDHPFLLSLVGPGGTDGAPGSRGSGLRRHRRWRSSARSPARCGSTGRARPGIGSRSRTRTAPHDAGSVGEDSGMTQSEESGRHAARNSTGVAPLVAELSHAARPTYAKSAIWKRFELVWELGCHKSFRCSNRFA